MHHSGAGDFLCRAWFIGAGTWNGSRTPRAREVSQRANSSARCSRSTLGSIVHVRWCAAVKSPL